MGFSPISFEGFEERERELKKIKRFHMFDFMRYRTNVFQHSQRVLWIVEELSEYAPPMDIEKARTLALVHDDAEMITGDIQRGHKNKMTPEQKEEVYQNELKAVEVLSQRYPKEVNGYNYRALLLHALNRDCIEAQLVKIADRIDGYGESMHEVYAGNDIFCADDGRPVQDYTRVLNGHPQRWPDLSRMFTYTHEFLSLPANLDLDKILSEAIHHTHDSIKPRTGIPHYDRWKQITLERNKEQWLTEIQEHQEILN